MTFAPGETVRLKSGGPIMTIQEIDDDGAFCVWTDKANKTYRETFALVLLEKASKGTGFASVRVSR